MSTTSRPTSRWGRAGLAGATALAVLGSLALAACGNDAPAGPAASGGGGVTLYSSMGYAEDVTKAFTTKTGIQVKLVYDSGGPLLTKVAAEKNNPQWNVLWVEGDTPFASLNQQKLLQAYKPNAKLNARGEAVYPKNQMWQPSGVTTVMAVLCDAAKVPTAPTSWDDLTGPAYKDKLGMNDPSKSGPTYPWIAGIMDQRGGEEQGKAYFTQLKGNGLKVFPTNGDTVHALETGEISCGIIQSSAALGETLKQKDKMNLRTTYLPKVTLLPGVMGIAKAASGKTLDDAKKFEDWVLSPEGQDVILKSKPEGASLYWPVVEGVEALPTMPPYPEAQHIDPEVWGPKQGDIVTWFTNTIK